MILFRLRALIANTLFPIWISLSNFGIILVDYHINRKLKQDNGFNQGHISILIMSNNLESYSINPHFMRRILRHFLLKGNHGNKTKQRNKGLQRIRLLRAVAEAALFFVYGGIKCRRCIFRAEAVLWG